MLIPIKTSHYHCFMTGEGKCHGEFKQWENGKLIKHCFYVNHIETSFDEILYPQTPEDRLYFKLKYNIPLLPVETIC